MKKNFTLGLTIVLVLALSFSTSSCNDNREKPPPPKAAKAEKTEKAERIKSQDIVSLLPEDADIMIKLTSIETLYNHFSVTENSIFGEPIDDLERIKKNFGFNPLIINDLKANGFDTQKPVGFAINDFEWQGEEEDPIFNGLFFIPVTDVQKATNAIKTSLKNESSSVSFSQQENMTVFADNDLKGYILEKENYLLIGLNPKADAKPFMTSVAAGQSSLPKAKMYQDVVSKIDSGQEIFVYVNIRKMAEKNMKALKALSQKSSVHDTPDMTKNLEYLKDYEGAGLSVDLENKDFTANLVANITSGSKAMNVMKDITFNKKIMLGIKENPAVLLSFAMNVQEYYDMLVKTLPESGVRNLTRSLEETKAAYGVDLEKEVIENLAGNFNLGIYDGISINMTNYNTLLTVSIKDEALMKNVLEKTISKLPPRQQSMITRTKVGNDDVYAVTLGFTQLYVGIKDNNLIVSVGKPMFEKAITGNTDSGFVSTLEDKALASALKDDVSLLYVDVKESFTAVKNVIAIFPMLTGGKPIDPKTSEAVGQFEYLLSTSKTEGNSFFNHFKIKTKFSEPFFKGLEKIFKDLPVSGHGKSS